jgi:hypothetical protein
MLSSNVNECKPLSGGGGVPHLPARGEAVQVDPIESKLKPPGTKRSKLNCDILLSTSAFEISLRRYSVACSTHYTADVLGAGAGVAAGAGIDSLGSAGPGVLHITCAECRKTEGAKVRVTKMTPPKGEAAEVEPVKSKFKAPETMRLKLKCFQVLLSNSTCAVT